MTARRRATWKRWACQTALVQRFTVDHHACEGRKCPEYGNCLYERAKEAAQQADIVVTNHALLCLNVLQQENKILPVRPVLVIDEAHELENYAVNALTLLLERGTLGGILNHPIARDAVDGELRRQAMESNETFFRAVRHQQPSRSSTRWALRGRNPGRAGAVGRLGPVPPQVPGLVGTEGARGTI